MSEKAKTKYVPVSLKLAETPIGKVIKGGGKADALIAFIKENTNSKGYFNFDILKRKTTGQYGETHSMTLNSWEPKGDAPAKPKVKIEGKTKLVEATPEGPEDEDIPF